MAAPYHHALSSARNWGGTWEDYIEIHNWFDQTKGHIADARHRALLHHSLGIFLCEQVFGVDWTIKSTGKVIPTRWIGEQHVLEDFGKIPSTTDFLNLLPLEKWMMKGARKLSVELEEVD